MCTHIHACIWTLYFFSPSRYRALILSCYWSQNVVDEIWIHPLLQLPFMKCSQEVKFASRISHLLEKVTFSTPDPSNPSGPLNIYKEVLLLEFLSRPLLFLLRRGVDLRPPVEEASCWPSSFPHLTEVFVLLWLSYCLLFYPQKNKDNRATVFCLVSSYLKASIFRWWGDVKELRGALPQELGTYSVLNER